MTEQELLNEQQRLQIEMSELLKKVRVANGFDNPFMVARELNRSNATVEHLEKGIAFPTNKLLHELIELYKMTPQEEKLALNLKDRMLKSRRKLKSLRRNMR